MFWSAIFALLTGLPGSGGPAVEQLGGESDNPTPRVALAVDLGAVAAVAARPLSVSIAGAASIAPAANSPASSRVTRSPSGHAQSGEGKLRTTGIAPLRPTSAGFAARLDRQEARPLQMQHLQSSGNRAQARRCSTESGPNSMGLDPDPSPMITVPTAPGIHVPVLRLSCIFDGQMAGQRLVSPAGPRAFPATRTAAADSSSEIGALRERLPDLMAQASHQAGAQTGDLLQSIVYGDEAMAASYPARNASPSLQSDSASAAAIQASDAGVSDLLNRLPGDKIRMLIRSQSGGWRIAPTGNALLQPPGGSGSERGRRIVHSGRSLSLLMR